MNCSESRIAISQLTGQENLPADLAGHLSACELCQQVYTDFLLHRELTELQVPEPETDFLVNALKYAATESEQAVTRRYSNWHWTSAVAASVLVALTGWLVLPDTFEISGEAQPPEQFAESAPAQQNSYREEVRIVIYSSEEHENAELTIELAENLELEGYTGERGLTWYAHLDEGANILTLPFLVRNEGGQIRVTSSFGGANHEVTVLVGGPDDPG